jgi:hypothetical protein
MMRGPSPRWVGQQTEWRATRVGCWRVRRVSHGGSKSFLSAGRLRFRSCGRRPRCAEQQHPRPTPAGTSDSGSSCQRRARPRDARRRRLGARGPTAAIGCLLSLRYGAAYRQVTDRQSASPARIRRSTSRQHGGWRRAVHPLELGQHLTPLRFRAAQAFHERRDGPGASAARDRFSHALLLTFDLGELAPKLTLLTGSVSASRLRILSCVTIRAPNSLKKPLVVKTGDPFRVRPRGHVNQLTISEKAYLMETWL